MTKSRKKVLIAEGSDHYKILEQIYHLLRDKCDPTFYLVKPRRYNFVEMFPSAAKSRVEAESFRGVFFFMGVLVRGWRYDIIYISTGPEGSHYTDIVRVVGFYLCCLIYGNKTVLTIRNIAPFLSSSPGIFSWLRSRAVRHLSRFTFETATMKKEFFSRAQRRGAYYSVSYVCYPDTISAIAGDGVLERDESRLRIGLLGSVTEERRDYRLICDALRDMSQDARARIELVIMGECRGGQHNPVIKLFEGLARVDCTAGILSEKDFALRGKSCDLLLAPLNRQSAYGTLKGSGAFGDAVYLKRRMIIPDFVDPDGEFKDFCMYYADASELVTIFSSIALDAKQGVVGGVFDKFETRQVYESLVLDLKLCLIPDRKLVLAS